VGVAKTRFQSAAAVEVLRGRSKRPLFVTAAGLPATDAAAQVAAMHGPTRIPTLVARADQLARGLARSASHPG
jgi:deoxyribonuclease V